MTAWSTLWIDIGDIGNWEIRLEIRGKDTLKPSHSKLVSLNCLFQLNHIHRPVE